MELHIAGGTKYKGLALDVHSRATAPETVSLAGEIPRQAPEHPGGHL